MQMKERNMGIVEAIIAILIAFGGGVVVGNVTAPKEVNEYQYIEQTQSQNQMQMQSVITVTGRDSVKTFQLEIDGLTNIILTTITNGVTNILTN
jgi:hypothetical protein